MDWIEEKNTLPSADNGNSLYIVYTTGVLGKRKGAANFINGKFTNIILSGGEAVNPEQIVTHWMPFPEGPHKSK